MWPWASHVLTGASTYPSVKGGDCRPGPILGAVEVSAGTELSLSWSPPQRLPSNNNHNQPPRPHSGPGLHLDGPTQPSQPPYRVGSTISLYRGTRKARHLPRVTQLRGGVTPIWTTLPLPPNLPATTVAEIPGAWWQGPTLPGMQVPGGKVAEGNQG